MMITQCGDFFFYITNFIGTLSLHLFSTHFDSVLFSVTDLLQSISRILCSRPYIYHYADMNMKFKIT